MEDLFLLLVLCLIFGIGFVIMAATDRILDEQRQKNAALAPLLARKLRSAKAGLFKVFEKTETAVCYIAMCDPDTVDCDGMNTVEQF